jgi:hypothetical protein
MAWQSRKDEPPQIAAADDVHRCRLQDGTRACEVRGPMLPVNPPVPFGARHIR